MVGTSRAGDLVASRFDDQRLDRRKLDHLTGAYQLGGDIGQISATSPTTMRSTLYGHVRLLALATMPLMAAFGATLAGLVGAISLGAFRGRNRGVRGILGRLSQTLDLLFEFGHPRLQLHIDLDHFRVC